MAIKSIGSTGHKGNAKHPLYYTWKNMLSRCYYKKHRDYHLYGGRGIQLCERWLDFNNFIADMGEKPTPQHQLDRIDSDGNYEPSNCRWVTPTENTINSRPRNGRKYKGVYQHTGRSNYFVMITLDKKPLHCGSYDTEEEAALAYNRAMLQFYGEKARLNDVVWE